MEKESEREVKFRNRASFCLNFEKQKGSYSSMKGTHVTASHGRSAVPSTSPVSLIPTAENGNVVCYRKPGTADLPWLSVTKLPYHVCEREFPSFLHFMRGSVSATLQPFHACSLGSFNTRKPGSKEDMKGCRTWKNTNMFFHVPHSLPEQTKTVPPGESLCLFIHQKKNLTNPIYRLRLK